MIKLNIQRFSSTNKTAHYELSQYVSSDLPTYLVDYNGDMAKIDTGINTAQTTADTASTAATNAATAASTAQNTANTAVTNAATADGKATTANTNIGTMANLTTSEKGSLVGAINELDSDIGTMSNLATDVTSSLVGAINSVENKIEELDNYSTTETDTGKKWYNNKAIYRKVINGTIDGTYTESGNRFTWKESGLTNSSNVTIIDEVIDIHGVCNTSNKKITDSSGLFNILYRLNQQADIQISTDITEIPLNTQFHVVIEYTKVS